MLNFLLPLPTPQRVATSQLAEAKLQLIQAEAQIEYYSALVPMLKARVKRLELYLEREPGDRKATA
jgi:hypothetical protein